MPETAVRPQNGAEGVYGGAGKNSYVKSAGVAVFGAKKPAALERRIVLDQA